jgi:hypothetical protein
MAKKFAIGWGFLRDLRFPLVSLIPQLSLNSFRINISSIERTRGRNLEIFKKIMIFWDIVEYWSGKYTQTLSFCLSFERKLRVFTKRQFVTPFNFFVCGIRK